METGEGANTLSVAYPLLQAHLFQFGIPEGQCSGRYCRTSIPEKVKALLLEFGPMSNKDIEKIFREKKLEVEGEK